VLVGAAEPIYRLGLRTACEAAGLDVRAELDHSAALLATPEMEPAVVVTDAAVLEPRPAEVVERASCRHRVLIIDAPGIDKPRLLRAGASGFVAPSVDPAGLRRAVEAADAGQLVLSGAPTDGPRRSFAGPTPHLTRREATILRLLADDRSTVECAQRLHLSVTTVKAHLRNANAKLGTTSRTAAVAKATALDLLP
jgi:DNA-binding NarL/FixJ family response regulator